MRTTDPNDSNVTRLAVRGTLASLVLRLVSFLCTQWTLRVVDPEILGRASIQLELMLTSILFLSREGFRLAMTRNIQENNWSVAWLSVPTTFIVSLLACVWHLMAMVDSNDTDYRLAGILFCFACTMEGIAEPAVLEALRRMDVTTKASAEGLATVTKTLATLVALKFLQDDWPVTAFGVAQLCYATIYSLVLWRSAWTKVDRSHLFGPHDGKTCKMVVVFALQGFFKHLLTEGDKLVLTMLTGDYDQGVYAMGSAYGGMAARILLQPIEENARLMWSRLASSSNASAAQLQASYTDLIKLVLYIGLIFSCLAVNYTSILLAVMAGRKWGDNAEAATVLSAFCVYTAFMAWNGLTEAFVYSIASSGADMGRLGAAHMVIAVVFACVAFVAVSKHGTVGLVLANCVAMLCRALYSVWCAARFFSIRRNTNLLATLSKLLRNMFPNIIVLSGFIACYMATRLSLSRMSSKVIELGLETSSPAWFRLAGTHVAVGATCGFGLLAVAYVTEHDFRKSIKKLWNGRME